MDCLDTLAHAPYTQLSLAVGAIAVIQFVIVFGLFRKTISAVFSKKIISIYIAVSVGCLIPYINVQVFFAAIFLAFMYTLFNATDYLNNKLNNTVPPMEEYVDDKDAYILNNYVSKPKDVSAGYKHRVWTLERKMEIIDTNRRNLEIILDIALNVLKGKVYYTESKLAHCDGDPNHGEVIYLKVYKRDDIDNLISNLEALDMAQWRLTNSNEPKSKEVGGMK